MAVGAGLYMFDVVVKRSRLLSHLLMSSFFPLVSSKLLNIQSVSARGVLHDV